MVLFHPDITFDKNVDTFYVCVSTSEIHIGLKEHKCNSYEISFYLAQRNWKKI